MHDYRLVPEIPCRDNALIPVSLSEPLQSRIRRLYETAYEEYHMLQDVGKPRIILRLRGYYELPNDHRRLAFNRNDLEASSQRLILSDLRINPVCSEGLYLLEAVPLQRVGHIFSGLKGTLNNIYKGNLDFKSEQMARMLS
jgi:hypothetical protein